MEQLKHECGIAMIRLRKPLGYFAERYGTAKYALNKLYLLMEKQHNRGQEGAGMACVKLSAPAGEEFMFRERAEGTGAITDIFAAAAKRMSAAEREGASEEELPFVGDIYMGHLRYSTTGRSGLTYVHPFLRRSNYRAATMALCGNFNMTNIDEIFASLVKCGQHPRTTADTTLLLEQIGHSLDMYMERLHGMAGKDSPDETETVRRMESLLRLEEVIAPCARTWDGGFVICGATGSGETFVLRDPWGIRPAFYHVNDEMAVVASERPVIQTVMDLDTDSIEELGPGEALLTSADGSVRTVQVLEARKRSACSFERIYFSRGSDRDIYRERKGLGAGVVPGILEAIDGDIEGTVFSFVPNTAEIAFYGMEEELENRLNAIKARRLTEAGTDDPDTVASILSGKVRIEKVAIKDIKLRTFITEGSCRDDLAGHVYDISYGSVHEGVDNLVAIDDSIVRGTTLRRSIVRILARLHPRRLVIVSSAPQIRYPDFYGIDMSDIGSLIAFRAAVELLGEEREKALSEIYQRALAQRELPADKRTNCVKALYDRFTDDEITGMITRLVTPPNTECPVSIVYQSLEALHRICPDHRGDWYFSGDYPTPGGMRLVNEAFIRYYETERHTIKIL